MSGRFEGLSDAQWKFFADLIPGRTHRIDRSPACARAILNTIFYVLFTGCRWCDVSIKEGVKRLKRKRAFIRFCREIYLH